MNKTMRPEDDDIDSRDKPCTCIFWHGHPTSSAQDCPRHGIDRYWQRVRRD